MTVLNGAIHTDVRAACPCSIYPMVKERNAPEWDPLGKVGPAEPGFPLDTVEGRSSPRCRQVEDKMTWSWSWAC